MRVFTEAREDWLTIVQLPGYTPDLNAIEGAWSAMKSGLGNYAARTLDEREAIVRTRLRQIQRQPDLINALLGQTGLTLDPPPPVDPGAFNLCKPRESPRPTSVMSVISLPGHPGGAGRRLPIHDHADRPPGGVGTLLLAAPVGVHEKSGDGLILALNN
jgi:hypothetical protein